MVKEVVGFVVLPIDVLLMLWMLLDCRFVYGLSREDNR